ncbi:MAG: CRTAC1 family protein, partial [Planctomycetota bacterium]
NDMGVALGDYDSDGDLDIYVTNIENVDPQTQQPEYNVLLRNDSVGAALSFTEVAQSLDVENGGWGWGTTVLDADNDGWLDLAATNGWRSGEYVTDTSRFFLNDGGDPVGFTDLSTATGFDDTYYGSALVSLDYDRDGDADIAQICMEGLVRLLENAPSAGRTAASYLVVRPRMLGPNHRAIGAQVRASVAGLEMLRLIMAGTSYLGQEPAEALFGLGQAGAADVVTVNWPDGTQTVLTDVLANQVLTVTHGGFGDLDADGLVDLRDFAEFQECHTGTGTGGIIYAAGCGAADFDADGDVDVDDHALFASRMTGP